MEEEKIYTRDMLEEELNEQQKNFCQYFLFNNRVQSYMKAYPDCEYKSASASATRLLEDVRIVTYVSLLKSNIEELTGVSKIKNVKELAKLAYSSIAHLHNTWIELKDFNELTDDQKEVIESIDTKIEQKQIYNTEKEDKEWVDVKYVKIKLYNKIGAIQEINKMMGYNEPEKLEHSGSVGIDDLSNKSTDELIKRAEAIKTLNKKNVL